MYRQALILGLGSSGKAAARLLQKQGSKVFVFDDAKKEKDLAGLHYIDDWKSFNYEQLDLFVPSPGILSSHPIYQLALKKQIPVKAEVELGLSLLKDLTLVGVTGTNGKTTVVKLLEHVLNQSQIKAKAIGNVGYPVCQYAMEHASDDRVTIVELSSYQLETMQLPLFDIGVILNITPDHLDRYVTMKEYAKAKCLLQMLIKSKGSFVVHEDIKGEYAELLHRAFKTFSSSAKSDFWVDSTSFKTKKVQLNLGETFAGQATHDRENVLVAWIICQKLGIAFDTFIKGLRSFTKPAHRIEWVKRIKGVDYFDDSKGTNIDAVLKAVEAMKGPVVLIAGGVDKKLSFTSWNSFQKKVKRIIVFGECKDRIYQELAPFFSIEKVQNLEEAVRSADLSAMEGDCVLLSPGCSSYDMFRDYAHRGDEFKRYINLLEDRRKNS